MNKQPQEACMPIKDINDLIRQGIIPGRTTAPKPKEEVNPKYTEMGDVVPPLGRGDFLRVWKEDRAELRRVKEENEKIVKERNKLRNIMHTTYSKDWPEKVSALLKENKDDKTKT